MPNEVDGTAMVSFEDAFENGWVISSAFFTQPESISRNWSSLELLVGADDSTFWAVVACHSKLPLVVDQLVRAVDESHATTSRQHRVSRDNEDNLLQFLVRFMSSLAPSTRSKCITTSSIALRFCHVLPSSLLFPVSLMLLRASGPVASTSVACFLLFSPIALTHFTGVTAMWYDSVAQIATRCVVEGKRGRFQRRSGDILPLVERTYRLTKHMWALMHTAPYLVDYTDIKKVVLGLRVVADVISPLIQHFVMTCDELGPRRPQLTRANAMLLNAAVGAVTLATLFYAFSNNSNGDSPDFASSGVAASPSRSGGRNHKNSRNGIAAIAEAALAQFEDSCTAHMKHCCRGTPGSLVARNCRLRSIFHSIVNPLNHAAAAMPRGTGPTDEGAGVVRLPLLFSWVTDPIPNCHDFAGGIVEGGERLASCLVLELVHQGFHVDQLQSNGFLTSDEARSLGSRGSTSSVTTRTSAVDAGAVGSGAPAAVAAAAHQDVDAQSSASGDPAVDVVRSVLPHFSVALARKALAYFHNDVEQLINEAVCGNLPPHLQDEVEATEALRVADAADRTAVAHSAGSQSRIGTTTVPMSGTDDDSMPHGDMETFLSSDLMEQQMADDGTAPQPEEEEEGMYATLHPFASTMSETLYVDDGFKEHTFEFLYEDERDDAEDGEVRTWGVVGADLASSDDDELVVFNNHNTAPPATASAGRTKAHSQPQAAGRDSNHHTSGGGGGGKRGGAGKGAKAAAATPPAAATGADGAGKAKPAGAAYAVKKTKERKQGGAKTSLMRSIKKGATFD